jgi:hypothetical protein
MSQKPERRLRSMTVSLALEAGINSDGEPVIHHFDVSLAYADTGVLREIVFVTRGKIGHGLDLLFHDLGIKLSRAIQWRHPDSGEVAP